MVEPGPHRVVSVRGAGRGVGPVRTLGVVFPSRDRGLLRRSPHRAGVNRGSGGCVWLSGEGGDDGDCGDVGFGGGAGVGVVVEVAEVVPDGAAV
jgi:hypothetical protein